MSTKKNTKKEVAKEEKKPTSLNEILKVKNVSVYTTDNLNEYKKDLTSKNLLELQEHAASLGLRPSHDRKQIEKTLINEFQRRNGIINTILPSKVKETPTLLGIIRKNTPKLKKVKPETSLESIIKKKVK